MSTLENSKDQTCTGNCPCGEYCPLTVALNLIGGKWKIPIICALKQDGPTRYNDLKRKVSGITNTMLASSLKELESCGLIHRKQYDEMPLRVEYSLAELSETLIPILSEFAMWGKQMHDLSSSKNG